MATKTYRYQFTGPTAEEVTCYVPGNATPGAPSVSVTQDWTFDDTQTSGTDLTETLATYGWSFVADVTA